MTQIVTSKVVEKTSDKEALGASVLESDINGPCAYLVLRDVPANAEVYLVDRKMTARGTVRKYRIPVRLQDTDYKYPIEIRVPTGEGISASAKPNVRASETTELWVTQLNDSLVLTETKTDIIESSTPLASR